MRKIAPLGLLATALVVGGISLSINKKAEVKEERDARIIVNFSAYDKSMTNSQVLAYQNYGISLIKENVTSNFKVVDRYTNLLNAVVLEVPSSQVNDIRKLNFVKNVDYDTLHHIETQEDDLLVIQRKDATGDGVEENVSANTMNVPSNTKKGEGTLIGILDSGFLLNHKEGGKVYTHETFTALPSSVSTKLSKEAVDGLSGLNAKTSAEVTSLYFNSKVPFFYDYAGQTDTYDVYVAGAVEPDNDVYSGLSDHGLHVASMAAGNGPTYKGIASNAQLALMKVFTEYYPQQSEQKDYKKSTGCFDTAVIAALEDASKLGCDVLNMSFGSDLNDFGENTIVFNLLQQLRDEGIWSNYAAGNSGKGFFNGTAYEGWTSEMIETGIMSGSANLESVMSVAASQADKEFFTDALQVGNSNIAYDDQVVSTDTTTYKADHPLYEITKAGSVTEFDWIKIPNFGAAADYKDIDVKDKIAVASRGENSFGEKYLAAKNAGAIALIIINNASGSIKMSFGDGVNPEIPVISVSYEDKDKFLGSGTLKILKDVYADNPSAGQMANFTSDGATYDFRLKPEISAPGHLVKGAVSENEKGKLDPTKTDTYAYWSGTSMATPNYSGAIALLIGEHIDDPSYAATVNARAMSTTTINKDKKGLPASVRIQGAGMINVENALDSDIYLESFAGSGKAKIEWQNNDDIKVGDLKVKFSATNEGAAASYKAYIDIYRPNVYKYQKGDLEIEAVRNVKLQGIDNVLIKTVEKTVNIPAGTSEIDLGTISLTAAEKEAIEDYFDYACPIEGFVRLEATSASRPNLSIPFLGYYGDTSLADPVEPFNFEKEAGRVYPSDLSNDIAKLMGFSSADFASMITVGSFKQSTWESESDDSPLTDWIYNRGSLKTVKDDNDYNCVEVGAKHNLDNTFDIYASQGDKPEATAKWGNTLLIQQYVTRSVKDNSLKIYKKSDMSLIRDDHMYDTFWGDDGEEEGEEANYTLAKSHLLSDDLDNGLLGHRAYSIIPLWDEDLNIYPEGEYVIEFKYTTMDDVVHTKTYNFVITNAKPQIESISEYGNNIRVRMNEEAGASLVNVIGSDSQILKAGYDVDGFYTDIPKSLLKKGACYYSVSGLNKISLPSVLRVGDDGELISVSSKEISTSHNFKITKEASGSTATYTLNFTKNNSATKLNSSVYVVFGTPAGYDSSDISIIDIDKDGNETPASLKVTTFGVGFESAIGKFKVTLGAKSHSIVGIGANLTKDTFTVGDTFDISYVSAFGIYDNGVTGPIDGKITVTGFDSSTAGKKTLTVKVGDYTTTVSYVVNEPPALLRIEALCSKKTYEVGEEFDPATIKVTAYYDDGSTKIVTSEVTYSGFDSSEPGNIILTVSYGGEITNISITITAKPAPANKGCGGEIITTSIIIPVLALAGIALLILRKKKED